MPAPAKTSDERILAAARALVARQGLEGLSMQALAAKVGVRAPSLYKRFADRDAIVLHLIEGAMRDLGAALPTVDPPSNPRQARDQLERMAFAYRSFAKRQPHLYRLLFLRGPESERVAATRQSTLRPVLGQLAALVAPDKLLPAARLLVSFLHGFTTMELDGAFHLDGSLDEAFAFGLGTLLDDLGAQTRR